MKWPCPQKGILEIEPYKGGRETVEGVETVYKLSANETPLGPSPRAVDAYRQAAGHLERYPDGSAAVLRKAIGARFDLDPERIVCGAGSDELLHLLCQIYLGEGDEAICTQYAFLVYPIATKAAGAEIVMTPETGYRADVDAMLAAQNVRTKVVFLANPNNPTGSYLSREEVRRLHRGLRPDVLLVLDAAYAEYVGPDDYEAGIGMVSDHANVVMTRTFSKAYGLAGLRIGWAYCPEHVADALNRVRGPFNIGAPSIAAAAAALQDRAHIEQAVRYNTHWRDWLSREIAALGLEVLPGVANFISIRFPQTPGRRASEADAFLCARGLVLRPVGAYGMPDCLRLSVGSEEANRKCVTALQAFMEETHG